MNAQGMDYLGREFQRLGLRFWESQGNFLLVDFGKPVGPLNQKLLADGLITRPTGGAGLQHHLRISVGTRAQNERLVKSLERHCR